MFQCLRDTVPWQAQNARIMGRILPMPRLVAWYGDAAYAYSGVRHDPLAWTPALLEIKAIAEALAENSFNSVLLNFYRDGRDSVSWHADNEASLGPNPVIASISLGAERIVQVKHRADPAKKLSLALPHGSCLIMGSGMQTYWLHQLPKTAKPVGPRINLTFRRIVTASP